MTKVNRRKCPKHGTTLTGKRTKLTGKRTNYGVRYQCPTPSCTVACWSGSTSTPADHKTRQARIEAHNQFDKLWKHTETPRRGVYRRLSRYMGLTRKETHIGMFSFEQCMLVLKFVKEQKDDLQ